MKEKAQVEGLGFAQKLRFTLTAYKKIWQFLASMGFSYICASSSVVAGISPFGAACCAASRGDTTLSTAIGAILGYIVSCKFGGMKYISAVIIIAAVKWFLSSGKMYKHNKLYSPLVGFCAMLATSVTVTAVYGFSSYDIVLSAAEALLCGGTAYFFSKTEEIFEKSDNFSDLRQIDASSLLITSVIAITILTDITIGSFSFGRIFSFFAVLMAAYSGRESMASVVGIITGFAVVMSMGDNYYIWAMYALGGLIAGIFSNLGRFGMTIVFSLVSGGIILASGEGRFALPYFYESMVCTVGFLVIPEKYLIKLKDIVVRNEKNLSDVGVKSIVISKLNEGSGALLDIASTTREVSKKITALKSSKIEDVYSKTAEMVCNKCVNKRLCWQKNYSDTMNSFNNMTVVLREKGKISQKDFTNPLSEKCIKPDIVAAYVNKFYEEFLSKEGTLRKVSQVRSVVTDQFEGMALMLSGIAEDIYSITSFDKVITQKITSYLKDKAIDAEIVNCFRDNDDRITIQIFIPTHKLRRVNKEQMSKDFSDICERNIALPEVFEGDTIRMTFVEKQVFDVKFAAVQYNCKGGKICGDSYSTFNDKNSKAHIVLSDGMGVGCSAAVDSSMTVSLIKKLICAGVSYDAALKTVNSALLVKSGEESLATIDIVSVDMHNGKTEFYKAGAAPTYVKKSGKTGFIESTSLPVGILNKVSFDKSSITLGDGDMVVVVSDGTSGMDDEWIRHTIQRFDDNDLQSLCDDIAKTAKLKRISSFDDDISVVACKIYAVQ